MTKPDAAAILHELERARDYFERASQNYRQYYEAALMHRPQSAEPFKREMQAASEAADIIDALITFAHDGSSIPEYPSTEDEG